MHIGFRYHIASLVAVFFALVLGMLVGSALFQDDRLVQEQGHIISDLENRFRTTELRTRILQDNLAVAKLREETYLKAWDKIRDVFIEDRLVDRTVVFISESTSMDWTRLTSLMLDAGAIVASSLDFYSDTNWKKEIAELTHAPDTRPLAIVWIDNQLDEQVVSGIEYLSEQDFQVSVIQSFHASISLERFGSSALVIDYADSPFGELALIQGLAQSLTGIYGWREGAMSVLPVLDIEIDTI